MLKFKPTGLEQANDYEAVDERHLRLPPRTMKSKSSNRPHHRGAMQCLKHRKNSSQN